MDVSEIREILANTRVNIWGLIEAAIEVACIDYGDELTCHRDNIISKLYDNYCPNCSTNVNKKNSPILDVEFEENVEVGRKILVVDDQTAVNDDNDDDVVNDDNDYEDEELRRIFLIKKQIEDPNQSEDELVDLLQTLADADITFKALKETDIGRHVNRLRKHPSSNVKRLVKLLVRKWKDLVDEWVKLNSSGEVQSSNNLIADGDSPQQNVSRNQQNGHHRQVPDMGYSPNPRNGHFGSDRNYLESEQRPRASVAAPSLRRDPPTRPMKSPSVPASAPPLNRQKEVAIDPDRFASARKRLQENYQEARNAKNQRTIQVMDIHEIPKPKNGFFGRNKGGFQRH